MVPVQPAVVELKPVSLKMLKKARIVHVAAPDNAKQVRHLQC